MKIGRLVAGVVVVLALGGGGWWLFVRNAGNARAAQPAHLALTWRGRYAGTMNLPATLNWCPVTRIGVLEGMSEDSGAVLVLYERDSLTAGAHAILSPDMAAVGAKPGASFVLRWMRTRPDTVVAGFRSEAGTARIQFANGKASGDINARLRSSTGIDTMTLTGVFTGIPMVTKASGCT